MIAPADYVVDFGPGAGKHGGQIVAAGTPDEVAQSPESLTGAYLAGRASVPMPFAAPISRIIGSRLGR